MNLPSLRAVALTLTFGVAALSAGCNRNAITAIELANEADKLVKVDVDGAISKYEQATKLDPSNHVLFRKLGSAYEKKEAWDKVASVMATASRLDPKNADYLFRRGKALRMLAEKGPTGWDEAREPLEKCVQVDPNYSDCYFQLGEVYLQTDDEQKAVEAWNKAIAHEPSELIFYGPLLELYVSLNYNDLAIQLANEGLKVGDAKKPGYVSLLQHLANAYQGKGDLANAAASLEKAKDADVEGQHPELAFALGSTYAVMSPPKKDKALQLLKSFNTRTCKGPKAVKYKAQCDQSQSLMQSLGGPAQ